MLDNKQEVQTPVGAKGASLAVAPLGALRMNQFTNSRPRGSRTARMPMPRFPFSGNIFFQNFQTGSSAVGHRKCFFEKSSRVDVCMA